MCVLEILETESAVTWAAGYDFNVLSANAGFPTQRRPASWPLATSCHVGAPPRGRARLSAALFCVVLF